jgi:hypothetical protein
VFPFRSEPCQKFDGRGELTTYVSRCAYLYPLQQVKKRRRDVTFTVLQNGGDFEEYLDEVLPYLEDPRYVEAIDDAHQILAILRDNANLGEGIGVDEYENGPLAAFKNGKPRVGRPTHNTRLVRKQIIDHLCDELQTDQRDIFSAYKALRLSTRQALNEGWLPT